ncbi:hypothetical protein F4823DRAFT_633185 [Ustulina deusta]|nr:hypothetical protein F4823DRAFT_633185 [Ustulina deusta]
MDFTLPPCIDPISQSNSDSTPISAPPQVRLPSRSLGLRSTSCGVGDSSNSSNNELAMPVNTEQREDERPAVQSDSGPGQINGTARTQGHKDIILQAAQDTSEAFPPPPPHIPVRPVIANGSTIPVTKDPNLIEVPGPLPHIFLRCAADQYVWDSNVPRTAPDGHLSGYFHLKCGSAIPLYMHLQTTRAQTYLLRRMEYYNQMVPLRYMVPGVPGTFFLVTNFWKTGESWDKLIRSFGGCYHVSVLRRDINSILLFNCPDIIGIPDFLEQLSEHEWTADRRELDQPFSIFNVAAAAYMSRVGSITIADPSTSSGFTNGTTSTTKEESASSRSSWIFETEDEKSTSSRENIGNSI